MNINYCTGNNVQQFTSVDIANDSSLILRIADKENPGEWVDLAPGGVAHVTVQHMDSVSIKVRDELK